mmetsp:Transcript_26803/g.53437  ORF Transcript_26803/g.53437 Transcript_26803/m.53437 type:complete len:200 (-) Transcript_26803:196-795(-)
MLVAVPRHYLAEGRHVHCLGHDNLERVVPLLRFVVREVVRDVGETPPARLPGRHYAVVRGDLLRRGHLREGEVPVVLVDGFAGEMAGGHLAGPRIELDEVCEAWVEVHPGRPKLLIVAAPLRLENDLEIVAADVLGAAEVHRIGASLIIFLAFVIGVILLEVGRLIIIAGLALSQEAPSASCNLRVVHSTALTAVGLVF